MNNGNRREILLKVIECIYEQHLDVQHIIDYLLVNVCRAENLSPGKVFFCFFVGFYDNGLL